MNKFLGWMLQLLVALIGVLLISGLPTLIAGFQNREFLGKEYIEQITGIFPLSDFLSLHLGTHIREYIFYSLEILFLSLLAAVVFALIFTILTMLFSEKTRQRIKSIFFFLEAIPDILVIMLVQLAIIFLYKNTGISLSIAVIGGEKLYALPVFCLMILPMVQLYRLSMLTFEAEERKMYVELARSLGYGKLAILIGHIFRNAIISVFFQSKKTMWFMLSNLFILERMFNMPGIMFHLGSNLSGELFLITVISFFFPVFIMYSVGEWYFLRKVSRGGALE